MSTLLGNTPADRLAEILAGSAAILSDPNGATSGLPISLTALTGGDTSDSTADQPAAGAIDPLSPAAALDPVTSLSETLGGDNSGLPVIGIGELLNLGTSGNSGGLPIVGDLLNVGTQGDHGGLPVVGDLLNLGTLSDNGGLPIVGDLLNVGTQGDHSGLPVVGDLLNLGTLGGSGGLPVIGDLLNLGSAGDGSVLHLAGAGEILQPIFGAANTAILDVHYELEVLGHELGLPNIVHGIIGLGETIGLGEIGATASPDGHTNLLTDALNAPGSILDGDLTGTVAHLGADLSDTINAVSALKDDVIFGQDPANPIPGIISSLGQDLQHIPLLTINGGNNASDGGLLGGIVGNLNGSSTGHLVDADVGPQQNNGLVANLLSQPEAGPHHTVEANAVDVGPTGPHLADLGLLTGAGGLNVPNLNGIGIDGLAGNLLGGGIVSGSTTNAPVAAPIDSNAIHDLASLITDHGVLDLHATHII